MFACREKLHSNISFQLSTVVENVLKRPRNQRTRSRGSVSNRNFIFWIAPDNRTDGRRHRIAVTFYFVDLLQFVRALWFNFFDGTREAKTWNVNSNSFNIDCKRSVQAWHHMLYYVDWSVGGQSPTLWGIRCPTRDSRNGAFCVIIIFIFRSKPSNTNDVRRILLWCRYRLRTRPWYRRIAC